MPKTFGVSGARWPSITLKLTKPKQKRQRFTEEEDNIIIEDVGDERYPNWNAIAEKIPGKTGRQCRERYQHYLSPKLSREPWTPEEDALIRKLHKQYGPNWAMIAASFGGKRTNNNVKNRWNNHLRWEQEPPPQLFNLPLITMPSAPETPIYLMNSEEFMVKSPDTDIDLGLQDIDDDILEAPNASMNENDFLFDVNDYEVEQEMYIFDDGEF